MHTERYIPALGRAWLTALYDPLVRFVICHYLRNAGVARWAKA